MFAFTNKATKATSSGIPAAVWFEQRFDKEHFVSDPIGLPCKLSRTPNQSTLHTDKVDVVGFSETALSDEPMSKTAIKYCLYDGINIHNTLVPCTMPKTSAGKDAIEMLWASSYHGEHNGYLPDVNITMTVLFAIIQHLLFECGKYIELGTESFLEITNPIQKILMAIPVCFNLALEYGRNPMYGKFIESLGESIRSYDVLQYETAKLLLKKMGAHSNKNITVHDLEPIMKLAFERMLNHRFAEKKTYVKEKLLLRDLAGTVAVFCLCPAMATAADLEQSNIITNNETPQTKFFRESMIEFAKLFESKKFKEILEKNDTNFEAYGEAVHAIVECMVKTLHIQVPYVPTSFFINKFQEIYHDLLNGVHVNVVTKVGQENVSPFELTVFVDKYTNKKIVTRVPNIKSDGSYISQNIVHATAVKVEKNCTITIDKINDCKVTILHAIPNNTLFRSIGGSYSPTSGKTFLFEGNKGENVFGHYVEYEPIIGNKFKIRKNGKHLEITDMMDKVYYKTYVGPLCVCITGGSMKIDF